MLVNNKQVDCFLKFFPCCHQGYTEYSRRVLRDSMEAACVLFIAFFNYMIIKKTLIKSNYF